MDTKADSRNNAAALAASSSFPVPVAANERSNGHRLVGCSHTASHRTGEVLLASAAPKYQANHHTVSKPAKAKDELWVVEPPNR